MHPCNLKSFHPSKGNGKNLLFFEKESSAVTCVVVFVCFCTKLLSSETLMSSNDNDVATFLQSVGWMSWRKICIKKTSAATIINWLVWLGAKGIVHVRENLGLASWLLFSSPEETIMALLRFVLDLKWNNYVPLHHHFHVWFILQRYIHTKHYKWRPMQDDQHESVRL